MIERLVSGGQTGVDRAALDAALELSIPCGGWCPKGRLAEDGALDPAYPLRETPSADYAQRTRWNVRDSDATLVLHTGQISGGTGLTIELAESHGKPCLVLDLSSQPSAETVCAWIRQHGIRTLNVAGPRESNSPGIARLALQFLKQCLAGSSGS